MTLDIDIQETIERGIRIVTCEIEKLRLRSESGDMTVADHKILVDYLKQLAAMDEALKKIELYKTKEEFDYGDNPKELSDAELTVLAVQAANNLGLPPAIVVETQKQIENVAPMEDEKNEQE